jgi:ABC-2 type transport system permease protein
MLDLRNIVRLGVKELRSLAREPLLLALIVYVFTGAIYMAATAMPETLYQARLAIVDEDGSPLSGRIAAAFYPPQFTAPARVTLAEVDPGLDAGDFTFVLDIPPDFQRDVLAGRAPAVQLSVDATRMTQSYTGSAYIQQIVLGEVDEFVRKHRDGPAPAVDLALRVRFNPNLEQSWMGALMETINHVTMLSLILAGAALIREREHGTIEHLLVMPVTPAEIMLAKIWANGLVVLAAASFALTAVVQGVLHIPIEGSVGLFLGCAVLHLFATTSMGIFMATVARTMPQFGLLLILTMMPLDLLSGGFTPRESMPEIVRNLMLLAPTTHFIMAGQAILFRGAGLEVVWPQFLALAAIGGSFYAISLRRFRRTIGQMAG